MENTKTAWSAGIKRTKPREIVFSILEQSDIPLTALDICAKMDKQGDSTAWPSTVYRILELFVQKGIVLKTSVMGNDMAVYELNRSNHKHYAVCMNCHKIITMKNCPMESFIPNIDDEEFHVVGHNLEVFGLCKDCIEE